jgi:hypothetical protein
MFEDHVATVRGYLNWYKKAGNDQSWGSYRFSEYLVSSCYKKMRRRIGHWAAVGIISGLANMDLKSLSKLTVNMSISSNAPEADLRFARQFLTLCNDNEPAVQYLWGLTTASVPPDVKGPFTALLAACTSTNTSHVYTTETMVDFHCLLVAVLISYSSSLEALCQTPQAGRARIAQKVLHASRLLSVILHSAAFATHIHLVSTQQKPLLTLPTADLIAKYRIFASNVGIAFCRRGDDDDDDDNPDDDKAEEEFVFHDLALSDASILMQNWMKLFVNYFTAKRIMEDYSEKFTEPIDIVLLEVNAGRQRYSTWDFFEELIRDILEANSETKLKPEDVQAIITAISRRIAETKDLKDIHNIFHAFRRYIVQEGVDPKMRQQVYWVYYTIHCEAAMAAFAAADPSAMTKELQDIHRVLLLPFLFFHELVF